MRSDLILYRIKFLLRFNRVRAGIVINGISFFSLIAVLVFYYWPAMNKFDDMRTAIEDRKNDIKHAQYTSDLAKAVAIAESQVDTLEQKLDAKVTQSMLVQLIADLARKNKVRVTSESYDEGKVTNGFIPLIHQLLIQGNYTEIRNFIEGLQELPSLTIAQEAILSRSADQKSIKAQLNVITYRREGGVAK